MASRRKKKEGLAAGGAADEGGGAPTSADAYPPFTATLSFSAASRAAARARTDALVVYSFEGTRRIEGLPKGPARARLEELLVSDRFRAKRGKTLLCHLSLRLPARRVIIAGLGRAESYDLDAVRTAAGAAGRRAAMAAAHRVTFTDPPMPSDRSWSAADRASALAEGFVLGGYRLRKYLTGEEKTLGSDLRRGEILVAAGDAAPAKRALARSAIVCSAVNLARDLVNEPAGALTPSRMASIAEHLAAEAGIECTVLDEKGIGALGMGAFLGVSRGSDQPPRLIHLVYRSRSAPARKVALLGKGLTFDSGGLSLKTSQGMETMKLDKAGASVVLSTMLSLPKMGPALEVHGLLGMTENMPGGSAMKPGDVVRTHGGKTIEVLNTDAEGRLVLADLLSYANGLGVDEIIDVATLTGACVVALGPLAGGVFGNDQALIERILFAADIAGEKLWPMPLYEEYREMIRSEIADVKNTGERWGGAITAALFLREFAGRRIPWAHLDIAGPAFMEGGWHPYMRRGATGHGVRTLLTYLGGLGSLSD